MTDAMIVDAVRTPLGRRNGMLAGWHPVDLAAHTLRTLVAPQRPRSGARRRRDHGLRHAGRRPGAEHRPQRRARGRVPRHGAGHVDRPAVRVVAAGVALRRAGRDRGCVRRGDRRRDREHVAGADGLVVAPGPRPVRPRAARPVPRARAAGALGRVDRRAVGSHPRGARRVRAGVAPQGRPRHRRRPVRARDHRRPGDGAPRDAARSSTRECGGTPRRSGWRR